MTATPDVLVLMFWLGGLEFKTLKFLFSCCLYIFLGNFPRFSVHKSLKILEKYIANFLKGYVIISEQSSDFSIAFNLADLVPWGHLQFANLLEKQTSKKIYFFTNPCSFNFRRFRQPIRSCDIVPTANQRYGQNLAVTITNVREFVSGPILVVAVRENVWEPLKCALF